MFCLYFYQNVPQHILTLRLVLHINPLTHILLIPPQNFEMFSEAVEADTVEQFLKMA